jgi:hypothetical protein
MTLRRDFKRCAAGRIAAALNHVGGERLFGSMLRRTLKAVERASARPAQTDTAKAAAQSVGRTFYRTLTEARPVRHTRGRGVRFAPHW